MKRKIIAVLITVCMAFSLCSCLTPKDPTGETPGGETPGGGGNTSLTQAEMDTKTQAAMTSGLTALLMNNAKIDLSGTVKVGSVTAAEVKDTSLKFGMETPTSPMSLGIKANFSGKFISDGETQTANIIMTNDVIYMNINNNKYSVGSTDLLMLIGIIGAFSSEGEVGAITAAANAQSPDLSDMIKNITYSETGTAVAITFDMPLDDGDPALKDLVLKINVEMVLGGTATTPSYAFKKISINQTIETQTVAFEAKFETLASLVVVAPADAATYGNLSYLVQGMTSVMASAMMTSYFEADGTLKFYTSDTLSMDIAYNLKTDLTTGDIYLKANTNETWFDADFAYNKVADSKNKYALSDLGQNGIDVIQNSILGMNESILTEKAVMPTADCIKGIKYTSVNNVSAKLELTLDLSGLFVGAVSPEDKIMPATLTFNFVPLEQVGFVLFEISLSKVGTTTDYFELSLKPSFGKMLPVGGVGLSAAEKSDYTLTPLAPVPAPVAA